MNGGAVKLQCLNGMYKLTIRTDNRYQPSFDCMLGNRDNAIRLLRFMSELKLTKNDVVDLENATENTLRLGLFGNLEIFSEGGNFSGLIAKKQCRHFRKKEYFWSFAPQATLIPVFSRIYGIIP